MWWGKTASIKKGPLFTLQQSVWFTRDAGSWQSSLCTYPLKKDSSRLKQGNTNILRLDPNYFCLPWEHLEAAQTAKAGWLGKEHPAWATITSVQMVHDTKGSTHSTWVYPMDQKISSTQGKERAYGANSTPGHIPFSVRLVTELTSYGEVSIPCSLTFESLTLKPPFKHTIFGCALLK